MENQKHRKEPEKIIEKLTGVERQWSKMNC